MASARFFGMFPGQGSQKVGMGKVLCDEFPVAKATVAEADDALGFRLSALCFDGPAETLTATENAQPAILTMSIACWRVAEHLFGAPIPLVAAAGHSLGEYSALVAAGALSFADAVRLVNKRGKFMQTAVPVGAGAMVAVLGKEVSEIEGALAQVKSGVAQIANINAPGQIVVAGAKDAVAEFKTYLPGAKVMELPVSAPFHCSLMQPAADALREQLAKVDINAPRFPIIQNFSAEPVTDAELIRKNLYLQVCGRVRWVETMQRVIKDFAPTHNIEFGIGNVLSGLLKRIDPSATRMEANTKESIEAALNALRG